MWPAWTRREIRDVILQLAENPRGCPKPDNGYDVRGADRLRELRPRGGRSPWRALYRRVGSDRFVLAAIAPEAQVDHRRFERAVAQAVARLGELEEEG